MMGIDSGIQETANLNFEADTYPLTCPRNSPLDQWEHGAYPEQLRDRSPNNIELASMDIHGQKVTNKIMT